VKEEGSTKVERKATPDGRSSKRKGATDQSGASMQNTSSMNFNIIR